MILRTADGSSEYMELRGGADRQTLEEIHQTERQLLEDTVRQTLRENRRREDMWIGRSQPNTLS